MSAGGGMIETIELTKRFGQKTAVDRLTLSVPPGECLAFLGPNAAGKTTTMKLLAGLLRPTSGRVLIGGIDLAVDPQAAKRLLGYVPDVAHLYDKLSGEEFLRFVGRLYGMDGAILGRGVECWLDRFHLQSTRGDLIEGYSHGMRQRLALAAALLHGPRALIIDEPLVGLDPQSARTLKQVLKEQAQAGVTIFLSTHTLSLAEELAHRIGIIDQGALVGLGSLAELQRSSGVAGPLEDVFLRLTLEGERPA